MFNTKHYRKKRVLLVDVDSSIPNLALMKISSFFKKFGFKRELMQLNYSGYDHDNREKITIDGSNYDKVFISAIFKLNYKHVNIVNCKEVDTGGTGYNIRKKLPEEVEHLFPDYSLYKDNEYSIGYLTRGCCNNCEYCLVPRKEGKLKQHSLLKEFYNPKLPKIMLLDNNFLASKNCLELLKELKETGKKITFKQGLDFRLLDKVKAKTLSELDYDGEFIFAFDRPTDKPIIKRNLRLWKSLVNNWRTKFFVLIGYNTTLKQDLDRVYFLRKNKCLPYIMRHDKCYKSSSRPFYTDLASWCNQPGIFKNMTFNKFISERHATVERKEETIRIIEKNKLKI